MMHLVCIVGFLSIVCVAAERCSYDANHMCDTEHAVTSEKSRKRDLLRNEHDLNIGSVGPYTSNGNLGDGCIYSKKFNTKCCVCLKAIIKFLPKVDALLVKKIKALCNANLFLKKICMELANKVKDKVIGGFFPGGPLKSCIKYKMCKYALNELRQ